MRFAAWYGVVVGVLILIQWGIFLATGNVPQLEDAPREIAFHLAAEFLIAIVVITGGVGSLLKKRWAAVVLPLGLGMVVYSVINSPGYFAQRSEWPLVGMFMVLLAVSALAVSLLIGRREDGS